MLLTLKIPQSVSKPNKQAIKQAFPQQASAASKLWLEQRRSPIAGMRLYDIEQKCHTTTVYPLAPLIANIDTINKSIG